MKLIRIDKEKSEMMFQALMRDGHEAYIVPIGEKVFINVKTPGGFNAFVNHLRSKLSSTECIAGGDWVKVILTNGTKTVGRFISADDNCVDITTLSMGDRVTRHSDITEMIQNIEAL